MDALRPGHAHRSSSDRLLNNYLDSQKSLTTSLLTLLSHSHSSTSSLLAYVTSSPGVLQPVRRSVRHAGFEGPLSASLIDSVPGEHPDSPSWAVYISSLERFRKDLKQIHTLELEMARVKRDREILVTRLIKNTKARPTKSDISAMATNYGSQGGREGSVVSSRASVLSFTSNGSTTASKEARRSGKLQGAQAELLGCEEHLRGLEVRIEQERNKVMMRGLEERFRAMEAVGRMWVSQGKKGLSDLEKMHELPADAYELDSNPSIAPSQSASQVDINDYGSPRRGVPFSKGGHHLPPGSIAGSIAEEDEDGSSGDEAGGRNLVVHENHPGLGGPRNTAGRGKNGSSAPNKPSPLGVPSINTRSRPISATVGSMREFGANDSDSDDGPTSARAGGRRAASDIGTRAYHPPTGRQPLRRTFSADQNGGRSSPAYGRAASDGASSIRSQKKKKGFFASISKFFKGPKNRREGSMRSGRDSPPYGSGSSPAKGSWNTRTDTNVKRQSSVFGGSRRRGGNDSSSDDEAGLVSVSNNRGNGFSVADVGRPQSRASGVRKSASTPVASGLIPKPTRSDLGATRRNSSQSTIGKSAAARATSPINSRANTPAMPRSMSAASSNTGRKTPITTGITRSSTMKSTASTGTVKSTGTTTKKARTNGSTNRAALDSQQAAEGRNIMSLVDLKTPPAMPEVAKAPKSQVTPLLELAKAPGSSLVFPSAATSPGRPASRAASTRRASDGPSGDVDYNTVDAPKSNTPLPPSRTLHAPLKSALRPTSPQPTSSATLPPALPLFSISAPGPVNLPAEEPRPVPIPTAAARAAAPKATTRGSYSTMASDAASVYESAVEDDGTRGDDSESEAEDEGTYDRYRVVENDKIDRSGYEVAPPAIERIPSDRPVEHDYEEYDGGFQSDGSGGTALAAKRSEAGVGSRRPKSVRMALPDSPLESTKAPPAITAARSDGKEYARPGSPDHGVRAKEGGGSGDWGTRIGHMREDTSDEEEGDEGYLKARKGLIRNSGKFEGGVEGGAKVKKGKSGTVKKAGSTKGSLRG